MTEWIGVISVIFLFMYSTGLRLLLHFSQNTKTKQNQNRAALHEPNVQSFSVFFSETKTFPIVSSVTAADSDSQGAHWGLNLLEISVSNAGMDEIWQNSKTLLVGMNAVCKDILICCVIVTPEGIFISCTVDDRRSIICVSCRWLEECTE